MKVYLRVLTVPSRLSMGCLFMERIIREFPDTTPAGLHYKNGIVVNPALYPAPKPALDVVRSVMPPALAKEGREESKELKEASNKKGFVEMLKGALRGKPDIIMLFEEDVYVKKGTLEEAMLLMGGLGKEAWCCSMGPYLRPGTVGAFSEKNCPEGLIRYAGRNIKMWGSHALALSVKGAEVLLQYLEAVPSGVTGWLTDSVITKAVSDNAFDFYITRDVRVYQMHPVSSLSEDSYEIMRAIRDAVCTEPPGLGIKFRTYPMEVCGEISDNRAVTQLHVQQSNESPIHGNFCFEKLEIVSDKVLSTLTVA